MSRPVVLISRDLPADWLSALEFGRVDDGVPSGRWRPISSRAAWLLDRPGGRVVGVRLDDASGCDLTSDEFRPCWAPSGPRFDAPTLGLTDVNTGQLLLAAQTRFGDEPTLNRVYFNDAMQETGHDALTVWQLCLEAGDLMAHYGLGYTHYGLEDYHAAYRHLRFYASLAPTEPWAWCWLGKAAYALGEQREAVTAWRRALRLEGTGEGETEARGLLDALEWREA